jgi:TPR repeat protein
MKAAITPANAYNLSKHERRLYANRAARGDIVAARKLAQFYFTNHEGLERTTHDDEKADYWNRVLAQLENSASKARREK